MAESLSENLKQNDLTLDEKLALIDEHLRAAAGKESTSTARVSAPVDPADLLMCEGCQ